MTKEEILERFQDLADPKVIKLRKEKYSLDSKNAIGITNKNLNELAKEIPKDSRLALELFDTGIHEARILCSKIFPPKELREELMEEWLPYFDAWDICDCFCMHLFAKHPLGFQKAPEWCTREGEFQRRAGFATLAALCLWDKKADNQKFLDVFPLILMAADDERNYVKKAVNWALRNIGKRNRDLQKEAIKLSKELLKFDSKSAHWIARDALRELEKPGVRMSDYPRAIYRPR